MKNNQSLWGRILLVQIVFALNTGAFAQQMLDSATSGHVLTLAKILKIAHFDMNEVSDKIHFDRESQLGQVFEYCLTTYELELLQLESSHQDQIETALFGFDQRESQVNNLMDLEAVSENLQILKADLSPIQLKLEEIELKLDSGLKLILNEKQYKRWEHHFVKKKKAASPRMPMPMAGPNAETLLF